MTPSARIQAIIDILDDLTHQLKPMDSLVSGYFRARRYIGSKDRGAISERTYAILRHQARLEWWMAYKGFESSPRLRVLLYIDVVEKRTPGEIDGLFDGKQYAPPMLTEGERIFLKKMKGHTFEHPDMPEATRLECPPWAEAGLRAKFGKRFAQEMESLLFPAALDLRINPLKISRENAIRFLKDKGFEPDACKLSPWGIRLHQRVALQTLALLKEGALEIQDEGSQLVAFMVDAKPGERIVDFCAGAGGKTLAIAAMMENKGRIVATDVMSKRLARSGERFRKAGLHNIETKAITTEHDPWVKRHKGSYDRVLVDAPCSGTGTWRRNPDARWRTLGPDISELLKLQASILDSASRLVKPEGRLVYATCSILPEENEKQIEAFLAQHPEFEIIPLHSTTDKINFGAMQCDFLSLSPAMHKTDGFFAAVLRRKA